MTRFSRTRSLVGDAGLARLANAHVAVFGLGGVGGYALEALARAGAGHIHLVDSDVIEASNLNRQILATEDALGVPKVVAARERILKINPDVAVTVAQVQVTPDNAKDMLPEALEFAVDAIDDVKAKIHLLLALRARGVRFVSCMGAARRLAPGGVAVADIGATRHCPLARAVRLGLRKQGVSSGVRCVYCEATPLSGKAGGAPQQEDDRAQGTISYVPGLIGLTAAGAIINDILREGDLA